MKRDRSICRALRWDIARRNGGDTSRFGAGRVFIFKGDTEDHPWQAHIHVPHMGGNLYGAGDTPEEAYAMLIRVIRGDDWGRLGQQPASEIPALLKIKAADLLSTSAKWKSAA